MFGFKVGKGGKEPVPVVRYDGFGAPYHIAYEYRELPGAGANQLAFETLALPRYSPIGTGIPNERDFIKTYGATLAAVQGVYLTRVGNPGIMAGAFVSGPLIDTSSSPLAGFDLDPGSRGYDIPTGQS